MDGRKVARSIVEPAQYDGQGGAAVLRDQRPNDQHGAPQRQRTTAHALQTMRICSKRSAHAIARGHTAKYKIQIVSTHARVGERAPYIDASAFVQAAWQSLVAPRALISRTLLRS